YIYDDFIEPDLQKIAIDYKENTLENVHFELVCLVAYNENQGIIGLNETEIKENIKKIISGRCGGINKACFSSIEPRVLDRINYIIFPIWELDKLLESFQKLIGSTK
ncbi:MAG TPA: hypothetical protein VD908_06470, partial [Cytophagales bacterium]|nr:hypothetical protein [Cytophagales bacterium]